MPSTSSFPSQPLCPQRAVWTSTISEKRIHAHHSIHPLLLGLIQSTILAHHGLGVPLGDLLKVGEAGAALASITSAQGTGGRNLGGVASGAGGVLQGSEEGLDGLGGQVFVVVVINLDHGGVDTGTKALNLNVGEEAVLGGVAGGDSEVLVDGLDDGVGAAAAELAGGLKSDIIRVYPIASSKRWTYSSADLDEVFADRLAVVHCVEGRDFVNAHGGHLEHAGNLVHDADAGEAVLALAKVEQGHNGGLLVLGWVALKDLIDEGEVLLGELERKGRVVVRLIAVLLKPFCQSIGLIFAVWSHCRDQWPRGSKGCIPLRGSRSVVEERRKRVCIGRWAIGAAPGWPV